MAAQQCVFCAIVSNQIPSRKVYADNICQALIDINPSSKGQLVVIPNKHATGIHDLSDEELAHISIVVKNLVMLLIQALGCSGINVIYPFGELAGQRSEHMIIYLVPRYPDDKVRILMEPLKSSEPELDSLFNALKSAMQGGIPVKKEAPKKEEPKVIKDEAPKVIKEKKKERVPSYW